MAFDVDSLIDSIREKRQQLKSTKLKHRQSLFMSSVKVDLKKKKPPKVEFSLEEKFFLQFKDELREVNGLRSLEASINKERRKRFSSNDQRANINNYQLPPIMVNKKPKLVRSEAFDMKMKFLNIQGKEMRRKIEEIEPQYVPEDLMSKSIEDFLKDHGIDGKKKKTVKKDKKDELKIFFKELYMMKDDLTLDQYQEYLVSL